MFTICCFDYSLDREAGNVVLDCYFVVVVLGDSLSFIFALHSLSKNIRKMLAIHFEYWNMFSSKQRQS